MAKREIDYHYLRVNVQGSEPRKYPSLGVGLISVPRVPVETPCFSRAPAPPPSQVIDYARGSVPSKTPKFTEENSAEEVNLAGELGAIPAGITTFLSEQEVSANPRVVITTLYNSQYFLPALSAPESREGPIGDCGCTGGIFAEGYASLGRVSNVIPVDVAVPGCPPSARQILSGILTAISKAVPKPSSLRSSV